MAENVIALRTSLPIDPWTGTEFCDWLKGHYTHVIEASFNPGRKIFIIEGLNVSDQQSVFLEDLNCFVARKSTKFHEGHSSSSNSDAIASESWDCPANFDPDRYAPFLKRIGDLTGTRITFDEFSQQVAVVGMDEASVKETIVRLNHLQAALSLLMASKAKRQHHHIFLPANGYNKLQLVPFKQHPSANTVRTVMTPTDWRSITAMGVLVPSRQGVAPQLTSANSRAFVASRFFSAKRLREFGNAFMYNQTLSSAESRASSIESLATSTLEAPQTLPPTRPKDYENLLLSDRTDRITSWVNQSTSKETNVPAIHDMELVPLAEYPPEQMPVKGLLRRRVKQKNAAPTVPEQAAATGHLTSNQSSQVTWEPLKPKPGPDFHRTMAQKASPDSRKQVKQATLHTFWPKSSAGLKNLVSQTEECSDAVSPGTETRGTPCDSIQQTEEKMRTLTVNSQPPKDFAEVDEIFNVLRPILEKARSFPGMLQLEAHIQLVTIALNGKVGTEILTSKDWKQILQFKDPTHRPSFFLWEKLTGSGGDVDSAIDLTWSKKNPKRLFQETPADDGIVYEFLCQMNDGSNFVISLDEHGRPSFNECTTELAWSTVHFPHRMWDVNLVLNGAMELQSYQDPSIKVVLDEFVRSIYFQPGSSLIIFCNQPADRTFTVQKILMKRWMRHCYIPLNQVTHSDLLLKTVEVHEFLIARKEGHHTLLRGRIPLDDRKKCVEEKKLWYEMSIVCDRIEKMLSTNRDLELGQKNEHWCADDFLREPDLSTHEEDASAASGSSGIVGMYRLAKTVLDRMKFGE